MNLEELKQLAERHNFSDPSLAAAIAMVESSGNPTVVGDLGPNVRGPSIGLWQIDMFFHKQWTEDQLKDPDTNAQAAYGISKGGTDWSQWSTAWEDPKHRIGYLGPKAPVRKFWNPPEPTPAPGQVGGSVMGTVLALFAIGGVTYYVVKK